MGRDFFDGLGEAISKTARELGGRAENLYETQKMKNKISGEEKQIQKIMAELGRMLYKRYLDGVPLDEAQRILCEQIDQRMDRISHLKEGLAGVRGRKICPSCGSSVDGSAAFCPHCGAACPTRETEDEAGDVVEEPSEEASAQEEVSGEEVEEEKAEAETSGEKAEEEKAEADTSGEKAEEEKAEDETSTEKAEEEKTEEAVSEQKEEENAAEDEEKEHEKEE